MAQHDRGGDILAHPGAGGGGGAYPHDDIIQSIPVPADKIGWVIGKEGSFIKQLEERSKAAVRISDSSCREYGREWKYVQVQGTPRAVDRAKKLLHIRLERLLQRLFAAGGEGGMAPSSTASSPTAAAAAMGALTLAEAGKGGEEGEQPVGAIEESGGAAAATVPAAAASVKPEV